MDKVETKIQQILNKLIAEEKIAGEQYYSSIFAADTETSTGIKTIFNEIMNDELNDHLKKLVLYAKSHDYSIPYTFDDYEKYAEPKVVKLFSAIKRNQKCDYYIKKAIEAEKLAIASYDEIVDNSENFEILPYDFLSIIWQLKSEEEDHLTKLTILKDALDNGAELIGF